MSHPSPSDHFPSDQGHRSDRPDHRVIGREMGLFTGDRLIGSGLPLWLPAGAAIRHELEEFAREIAAATGCQSVYSPVLAKRELFQRSGHWAKFADDMFPPMDLGGEDRDQLVLRPANCPHHALIYAAEQHSYRELPLRYNELAPMFRSERSGVLSGMSRVRQINLDDTHVFCRPDQIGDEAELALRSALQAFGVLGIQVSRLRLSRRDDSDGYLGREEQWNDAEDQLRRVLARVRHDQPELAMQEVRGEAAFYGPKIDIQVVDPRGHEESLSTVQLDFNQPERLGLSYVGPDGSAQQPIMIHRGLLGAMERMIAFLLEIHNGRLPLWLAPVQVCLLPVSAAQQPAVAELAQRMRAARLRVRVEDEGSLGHRIRDARVRRDAMLVVIGDAELAAAEIELHDVGADSRIRLPIESAPEIIRRAVAERRPSLDHQ